MTNQWSSPRRAIRAGVFVLVFFIPSVIDVYGVEVRMVPRDIFVEAADREEPLSTGEIVRISLAASGVDGQALEAATRRFLELLDQAPETTGEVGERGEELLEWMHREVLRRYVEEQTRMDSLLENGTYNCVSSAVLYLALTRVRGIETEGVLTTDHAFCRVGGLYDVETTTPYGFDPGTRKEAVEAFSRRTGFAYVPPANYTERRSIGDKTLLSLILQNRIAALQRRGRWTEAVGLAWDRYALSGDESARSDLIDAVNNKATDFGRGRKYAEGLRFLFDASRVLGEEEALEYSAEALLNNGIVDALNRRDVEAARMFIQEEETIALVTPEFVGELTETIDRRVVELAVRNEPFSVSTGAVDEAFSTGLIDEIRWKEYVLYLWSREANRLSTGNAWVEAWEFLKSAPPEVVRLPEFAGMLRDYEGNVVALYHNRFTRLYRADRYGEAEQALDEGLRLVSDHPVLLRDREILENARR